MRAEDLRKHSVLRKCLDRRDERRATRGLVAVVGYSLTIDGMRRTSAYDCAILVTIDGTHAFVAHDDYWLATDNEIINAAAENFATVHVESPTRITLGI